MTEKDTRDDEDEKAIKFVARIARLNDHLGKLIFVFMAIGAILFFLTDPEALNIKSRFMRIALTVDGWLIFLAIIFYFTIVYYLGRKIEDPDFTKLKIRNMVKFYLDDQKDRKEYEEVDKIMKKGK